METTDPFKDNHQVRSDFVRGLVQSSREREVASSVYCTKPPRRIVQFWNDLQQLPDDVRECMESWRQTEEEGFELTLFDERKARDFIRGTLGQRYEKAYDKCYHPAMQSDYFRLCYILAEGGCYVDADDVYCGSAIHHLFSDSRLKIQPLCYDVSTGEMIPPSVFIESGVNALTWIFYFNNNPLIAGPGHPIVKRALVRATLILEQDAVNELPEIQSTTGPGNLTKSIFDAVTENGDVERVLLVLREWESIATSRWPLSYRNDERNWRLSNRRDYRRCTSEQTERGYK